MQEDTYCDSVFYNPETLNPEVWDAKPKGYLTETEYLRILYEQQCATPEGLLFAKKKAQEKIDAHTDALIADHGVDFDGHVFDMSTGAQMRWLQLMGGAQAGIIQFPTTIITSDNKPYVLKDAQKLGAFLAAVAGFLQGGVIAEGQMLKARVEAAQTLEELEAITDDR